METTPNEVDKYMLIEAVENAIIEAFEQGVEFQYMSSAIDELLNNLHHQRNDK